LIIKHHLVDNQPCFAAIFERALEALADTPVALVNGARAGWESFKESTIANSA
jgi:hypothetical protein